jgi:uncharacterized membrane protein YdjX (TVP38/TMEM64 family)
MELVSTYIEQITNLITNGGPIVGFLIIILESFIPPLPLGVFVALNCNAFGVIIGVIISYIATIIGCILSYLFFKSLSNKHIYKHLSEKNKERVKRGSKRFNNLSLSGLVLVIALPFTPAFLVNIIAGASNLPRKKFIAALLIGKISTISFWGIIGKSFIESMTDLNAIIYIVIALLVAYIISKIVSKKMHIE